MRLLRSLSLATFLQMHSVPRAGVEPPYWCHQVPVSSSTDVSLLELLEISF